LPDKIKFSRRREPSASHCSARYIGDAENAGLENAGP